MSPSDVVLVQSSFRRIVPIAEQTAALFYARLFELDPELRSLFCGDMQQQGCKLIVMLARAIALLDQVDTLVPTIRALGVRHSNYGVVEKNYATVGAALLWTLQKGLGPEFTPAVANAWSATYSLLSQIMMDAQREARAAA